MKKETMIERLEEFRKKYVEKHKMEEKNNSYACKFIDDVLGQCRDENCEFNEFDLNGKKINWVNGRYLVDDNGNYILDMNTMSVVADKDGFIAMRYLVNLFMNDYRVLFNAFDCIIEPDEKHKLTITQELLGSEVHLDALKWVFKDPQFNETPTVSEDGTVNEDCQVRTIMHILPILDLESDTYKKMKVAYLFSDLKAEE